MANQENTYSWKSSMAWIFSILLLFFFFDLVNLQTKTYGQWLLSDYALRMIVIAVVFAYKPFRRSVTDSLRIPIPLWKVITIAFLIAVFNIVMRYKVEAPLYYLFPQFVIFPYPQPTSTFLHAIDLTFGLTLVAASEEFLFRVLMPRFFASFHNSKVFVLLGSSLLFGLVHWEHGVGSVVAAFIIGVVLMYSVQRTGSLRPALLAHYLMDLWIFW